MSSLKMSKKTPSAINQLGKFTEKSNTKQIKKTPKKPNDNQLETESLLNMIDRRVGFLLVRSRDIENKISVLEKAKASPDALETLNSEPEPEIRSFQQMPKQAQSTTSQQSSQNQILIPFEDLKELVTIVREMKSEIEGVKNSLNDLSQKIEKIESKF